VKTTFGLSAGPIRWIGAALLLLAIAAALGWHLLRPALTPVAAPVPSPALWRIEKQGKSAFLFGTFHAVPGGKQWFTPPIAEALAHSDRLVLEVTGLENERADGTIFERLARSPGLPPVEARLDPANRAAFAKLVQSQPMLGHGLDSYESWAAALLIGSRGDKGADVRISTANAPEEVLAAAMRSRSLPIDGLETIASQLGLFDAMDEALQRRLLANAVEEAEESARLFAQFHSAWASGDMAALERFYAESFAGEEALRRVLVDQRNVRWAAQIDTLAQEGETSRPFIAVGAGHFVGPANLLALLTARGWRIERIR
jgi:uncharacterized protein